MSNGRGLGAIGQRTSFYERVRKDFVLDSMTIAILAFVIVFTLVIFAATTTFSNPNCQALCQVHT